MRHRGRGQRGELGRRPADPVPRPDDDGHRRGVRARPCAARSTATRTGSTMSTDRTCRRSRTAVPASVEIFDTTLRDGAQFEGISLTVEDKLRVAEQLDWLGVRWIEGGYPQANPKDAEFFRRAPKELKLSTAELVAFGSTRRPAGKVDVDPTLEALIGAETSTVCIVGQELGLPRHRGAADHARRGRGHGRRVGRVPEGAPAGGCSSTPSTSSTATRPTPSTRCGCSRRRRPTAPTASCCATRTAARCPTRCSGSPPRSSPTCGAWPIGIHTQNDSGCAVANSIAAVLGGATHVQGTINGYGERTGNANLMTVIPDLTLKLGIETLPEGRLERLDRGEPPRRRAGEPAAAPGRPLRRAPRRSPTRAGCTPRRSAGPAAPPTSTSTRPRWATTPGCWCATSAGGPACP